MANVESPGAGVWRDGKLLVVKKGARLPDLCVRCGASAQGRGFQHTFHWHPPALYLLALPGLLIYAIVALVVRKSAAMFVGFCPDHARRYRIGRWGSNLLALTGVVLLLAAITAGALYGWTGLAMILAAAAWGSIEGRMLTPANIDDGFARLKGVSPAYLQTLPIWGAP